MPNDEAKSMIAPTSTVARRSFSTMPYRPALATIELAHLVPLELAAAVDLVVARDHDVVEVDVDGDTGDARIGHARSSRQGRLTLPYPAPAGGRAARPILASRDTCTPDPAA